MDVDTAATDEVAVVVVAADAVAVVAVVVWLRVHQHGRWSVALPRRSLSSQSTTPRFPTSSNPLLVCRSRSILFSFEDGATLNSAMQQFVDKLASLTQEIESMAPNMRAVDRLDEVKERLRMNADDYQTSIEVAECAAR